MMNYSKIVKLWSKSKIKPLSQQTPNLNKSPTKKERKKFGPRDDTKITWAKCNKKHTAF